MKEYITRALSRINKSFLAEFYLCRCDGTLRKSWDFEWVHSGAEHPLRLFSCSLGVEYETLHCWYSRRFREIQFWYLAYDKERQQTYCRNDDSADTGLLSSFCCCSFFSPLNNLFWLKISWFLQEKVFTKMFLANPKVFQQKIKPFWCAALLFKTPLVWVTHCASWCSSSFRAMWQVTAWDARCPLSLPVPGLEWVNPNVKGVSPCPGRQVLCLLLLQ